MVPPSSRGCGVPPKLFRERAARQGYIRKGQKINERKLNMKNRNTILVTILSALACFALLPKAQADPAPNPPAPGVLNTRDGQSAMPFVSTGAANSAFGAFSLFSTTTGNNNTAVGVAALDLNNGDNNTAVGTAALLKNTANGSVAVGTSALLNNVDGAGNTALGAFSAGANDSGDFNTALGNGALFGNTSGNSNIAIGFIAGGLITTASNVICIGNGGGNVSNSCFIGQIYSNVQPVVGTDPDLVTINSSGRLGRANLSSRRYKHEIQSMDKASEVLFALKPVSFRYNKEYDATQTIAFGLIAEDVAEVAPSLVGRNPKGEPESVRYEQINAMLLNEFLKEHKKVKDLEATVAQQQKGMEVLTAQLKEQAGQIQKVSAQLEVKKPAAKVVLSNP
jgi:Chaperone of endosialidase